MTTKQEYEDDPQGYWDLVRERKEDRGSEILEQWERENPHLPYGYSPPRYE
jgi:hypothetical protein